MTKVTALTGIFLVGVAIFGALGFSQTPGPATATTRPAETLGNHAGIRDLSAEMGKLLPLAERLAQPKPGEWLYQNTESGQTFREYMAVSPTIPGKERRTICVQPLGRFNSIQRQIVAKAAEFLGIYYGLEARVLDGLPLSLVPAGARRVHPEWGDMQINTRYILEKVLLPRMPKDAFAYIALTTTDLWPGEGWNYVFGSASLRHRVGVWSLSRYGSPAPGDKECRLVLLRTLKTAAHETGHMFSIPHCTSYHCCMNGSNGLAEADRRPIALCPECLAKVCWATQCRPTVRYGKLTDFYHANGLGQPEATCRRALKALLAKPSGTPATKPVE